MESSISSPNATPQIPHRSVSHTFLSSEPLGYNKSKLTTDWSSSGELAHTWRRQWGGGRISCPRHQREHQSAGHLEKKADPKKERQDDREKSLSQILIVDSKSFWQHHLKIKIRGDNPFLFYTSRQILPKQNRLLNRSHPFRERKKKNPQPARRCYTLQLLPVLCNCSACSCGLPRHACAAGSCPATT